MLNVFGHPLNVIEVTNYQHKGVFVNYGKEGAGVQNWGGGNILLSIRKWRYISHFRKKMGGTF